LFSATGVYAEAAIPHLLGAMQQALSSLNYHGTLVYLHAGEMQSMHIVHKADASGERERLINLTGPGREVLRHNDEVTCFIPDQKVVMVGKRQLTNNMFSKIAANDFQALQEFYTFVPAASGRIAGRDAQRVDIIPKDKFRYGYRLWLDRETTLLLRSDLIDEQGEILEQTMFADIEIVDFIPDAMLMPNNTGEEFNWYREGAMSPLSEFSHSDWRVEALPSGFSVTGRYRHPLPETAMPAEHWVISDGLSSVSIYVEEIADEKNTFAGPSRMGVMNVFGATLAGHQITVIGDVPLATVEMIATGVSHVSPEAKQ
jgi:sigma-E factor negative regulatory protein RseB